MTMDEITTRAALIATVRKMGYIVRSLDRETEEERRTASRLQGP